MAARRAAAEGRRPVGGGRAPGAPGAGGRRQPPAQQPPAEADPDVARAAATGDWSGFVALALRRALEAVPREGHRRLEQTRVDLQRALQEQAETGEAEVAGIYLSVLTVQKSLSAEEERAAFGLVARYVRDAVAMSVVKQAGGHEDMEMFNAALGLTFETARMSPEERKDLNAKVHMAYQVLFKGVGGAFLSNAKRQNRTHRPARADRRTPQAASAGEASSGTEPEAEQAPAMEPEAPEEAPQEPAGGYTPASGLGLGRGGAELTDQEGAAGGREGEGRSPGVHVPKDLSCEDRWRSDVEALLAAIVCPATEGAVCRACVKDLGDIVERSRDWLGDLWSQGSPGQHFCDHLLDTLSDAIERFPEDLQMHGAYIKMSCTVCEDRGDILGQMFPGPAQPEPSIEYMPATRKKVRAAVSIVQAADRSDSSILHEERIRLLVRTQKLPDLLCALGEDSKGINDNVRLGDQKLLLQQAKNGLDLHIKNIVKPIDTNQHQDREQAKAFLKEVLRQQQRRSYHTQDWVQGGNFGRFQDWVEEEDWVQDGHQGGPSREHSVDRFRMHMRFTVAGLLFGFEEQILTPIRTSQDTHMLDAALKAVRTMDAIMPLSESTSRAVVHSFRSINGPIRRRNCDDSQELAKVWMECEATQFGVMGTLLKGSISEDKWPRDVIQWAVHEACDAVDHASSVSIVQDMGYHASVVSLALWCLIEMLDSAQRPSGDLAASVDKAAQQAVRHLAAAQDLPFARMALSNAMQLFEKVHGPTATP